MKNIAMHTDQSSPSRLRRLLLLFAALFALLAVLPAQAQSCSATSSPDLDFGTVTEASTTDAQTSVDVSCQAGPWWAFSTFYYRVCIFVDQGTPTGLNPRRMTNDNGAFMNYNLYSDAARSQLLGPIGSTPVYSATIAVPWLSQPRSINLPIYGRVPAGQNIPAPYPYHGLPAGSVVRYTSSTSGYPSVTACQGSGTQDAFSWTGVRATYANLCTINTATDLDFGNAIDLLTNHDQTSLISLRCTIGTAWKVRLDDGLHYGGGNRRMANIGGDMLLYELYRDPGRSQRWGGDDASDNDGTGIGSPQNLTVYGRVPAQPVASAGAYNDTITVTLVY